MSHHSAGSCCLTLEYILTLWSFTPNGSLLAKAKNQRLILSRSPLDLDDGKAPKRCIALA